MLPCGRGGPCCYRSGQGPRPGRFQVWAEQVTIWKQESFLKTRLALARPQIFRVFGKVAEGPAGVGPGRGQRIEPRATVSATAGARRPAAAAPGPRRRPAAACGPDGAGKKKSRASGPARVDQVGMSGCSVPAPTGHRRQTSQTGAEEQHGGGLGDGGIITHRESTISSVSGHFSQTLQMSSQLPPS